MLFTIAFIHPCLIKTTKCASTYFTLEEVARVETCVRPITQLDKDMKDNGEGFGGSIVRSTPS